MAEAPWLKVGQGLVRLVEPDRGVVEVVVRLLLVGRGLRSHLATTAAASAPEVASTTRSST
ncbi:MAG: hypothetical protein GU356_05000 [Pyrobaculum sp.]|nr:hypothetical protein [Pyrobaculum sp.]